MGEGPFGIFILDGGNAGSQYLCCLAEVVHLRQFVRCIDANQLADVKNNMSGCSAMEEQTGIFSS